MRFLPQILEVRAGEVIVWNNKDLFPHTATSDGSGFDSGAIPDDGSWKMTASAKGRFPYKCALHPSMQGTLVVK
jgi:plastocyanin